MANGNFQFTYGPGAGKRDNNDISGKTKPNTTMPPAQKKFTAAPTRQTGYNPFPNKKGK